ncbi:uncharacterized protein LOC144597429 [Rhinoraja longicauda]
MAEAETCEVWGELTDRSGECRRFSARARCTTRGILGGVHHLQEQLGSALNEMVLQEKQKQQQQQQDVAERVASGSDQEEEEEEDDDDDEEDSEDKPADQVDGDTPPTKRTRIQS